jgi:NitT/TauT family transport system ATP-binding protein
MQPLANVTPLKRAGSIQVQNVGQVFRTTGAEVVALSDGSRGCASRPPAAS